VCDQQIAGKLGIPGGYLRRVREHRPGLYDVNVNGWLAGDDRTFLLRCLRSGGGGVVRAFLSDRYKYIANLDVLLAALDGVRGAGVPVQVDGCDLTERRMYVRVVFSGLSWRTRRPAAVLSRWFRGLWCRCAGMG
jgi:hypothetical protein